MQKKYNNSRNKPGCGSTPEKSLTQQSQANDADINTIVARAKRGQPLPVSRQQALYGDFTGIGDYRECVERINDAHDAFMTLGADTRLRFGNDPGALIDFLSKEENREEAIALGLIPKPEKTNNATIMPENTVKPESTLPKSS